MEDDIRMRDQLSYQEKNRQLYIRQKEMLALFLQKRAISQEQYEKSLHDLTEKMGYGTASARISRMIRARPKPTPFSGLSLRSGM